MIGLIRRFSRTQRPSRSDRPATAKACPRRVEATFFALLMAVFNGGTQSSQVVGGYLYDWLGYTALVLISAAFTAVAWFLVPLVQIDRIEVKARAVAVEATG